MNLGIQKFYSLSLILPESLLNRCCNSGPSSLSSLGRRWLAQSCQVPTSSLFCFYGNSFFCASLTSSEVFARPKRFFLGEAAKLFIDGERTEWLDDGPSYGMLLLSWLFLYYV